MIQLDRPVEWQKVTINPDAYGQQEEVWAKHKTVWAGLVALRGYETYEAEQKVFVGNTRFIVRYDIGWEAYDRLVYNGTTYDIVSIQEYQQSKSSYPSTREHLLLLDCQDRDSENTGRDG